MRPPLARTALSASAVSARHRTAFGVHPVAGGVVGLHRQERARPDMQRHLVHGDAARREPRQQLVGEMQARGRRRDRALVAREQGLVVGAVLLVGRALAGDIGRQRHVAPLGDGLVEHRPVERERQRHLAALALALDRGVELAEEADLALLAEADDVAGSSFFAGRTKARQREPSSRSVSVASIFGSVPRPMRRPVSRAGITLVSLTTSASPGSSRSGRSRTPSVVELRRAARPHHQQPRRVARRRRPQRDALGRQVEVEEVGAHVGLSLPAQASDPAAQ